MSSKQPNALEKSLYEPIRSELFKEFIQEYRVHLEVSAEGRISELVKETLDDVCLHIIDYEVVKPDIIGFIEVPSDCSAIGDLTEAVKGFHGTTSSKKIVVEVKRERISIADIIQTKMYGEIFGATHAILVSPKPIPEQIKRFDKMKPQLMTYLGGNKVKLVQFNPVEERLVDPSWYPDSQFNPIARLNRFHSKQLPWRV